MSDHNKEAAEREAFEKWVDSLMVHPGHAKHHRHGDSYCTHELINKWKGWLARSALTASEAAAQRLRAAIIQTLNANRHLADGDNCTLLPLKIALRESGAPWEGDSVEMVEQEAQEPGEREAALQGLIDQAQELDMGYGPNACPTCGKSGGMPIHSITFCNASFNGTPPGCNHEGTCEEWRRAIEARSKAQGGKQ